MWQFSLKLSEVLSDIGVTESMVQKRRRTFVLMETVDTVTRRLEGRNVIIYNFGSQSEGSTTVELDSDIDTLFGHRDFNVIQDCSEWKHGAMNVMMVKDETTSPGCCLLQILCSDIPLPVPYVRHLVDDRYIFVDGNGRVLLKNTYFDDKVENYHARNGPAYSLKGFSQINVEDYVHAWFCKSWPMEAQSWLVKQGIGKWPTEYMKRYCETTGCFVVPVSSKSGQHEETEWRISTSQAERCLMFSLNITQIRCYVLMKLILKTFIHSQCNGVITSFMCKTVLFHCIKNTSGEWQKNNLLEWLNRCILILIYFVYHDNCPHFMIPENNLLRGKLSSQPVKQKILEILHYLIQSKGIFLFKISIDSIGNRLMVKLNMSADTLQEKMPSPSLIQSLISVKLLKHFAAQISNSHKTLLNEIAKGGNGIAHSKLFVFTLAGMYTGGSLNWYEKTGYSFLIPFLCSTLASALASHDLAINNTISQDAMGWFSAGLNSDVSSGKLKFASALYCLGDMDRTESTLEDVIQKYDNNTVEKICKCKFPVPFIRQGCIEKSNTGNEELIRSRTSFCVRFTNCETRCVPHELQYEMFRYIPEERLYRHKGKDYLMDWVAVDSLPYLYFLQYKTYCRLKKVDEQERAFRDLARIIDTEKKLGHRETALNL